MTNRRFTVLTFAAVAFAAFLAPSTAGAQSVWDRIRDRAEQEQRGRDRDEDWRRDRRDDDRYGRRGGRISDYERRQLRELARRVDDRSRDLQRDIDRALDNSRHDGTRREDRVNNEARDLRQAAQRFRDVAGDSDYLAGSRDEASRLLREAERVSRMLGRLRVDSRASDSWRQLRSDLRQVANVYNLRFDDDRGYNNRRW